MSKIFSIFILFLSISVQAALPKELPASPAKFLTGACLTRSEDLWITAEAGGVWNAPNRRLSVFGNSRRSFAADIGFRQRKNGDEIILPSLEKLYKKEGKRLVISGKCCILYGSVFVLIIPEAETGACTRFFQRQTANQ